MSEKHSLNIFTDSRLSDTTFLLSIGVLLTSFNVLSVRYGFIVLQNCLLPVPSLKSRLLKKDF